MTIKQKYTQ